jgi:hypothetical protein
MRIEGSGSISQRDGSPDPDPHQNVMDPQHCRKPISDPDPQRFDTDPDPDHCLLFWSKSSLFLIFWESLVDFPLLVTKVGKAVVLRTLFSIYIPPLSDMYL